jgi:alpha-amylase
MPPFILCSQIVSKMETPSNDMNFGRNTTASKKTQKLFVGGDLKGITQKIEEGYFNDLGIDAIWFSPVNEQIHGSVDEGQGKTYAFHGYWIKDWTAIEPNWGTEQDLKELMKVAHKNNIRVLMDVIINHTGPVNLERSGLAIRMGKDRTTVHLSKL